MFPDGVDLPESLDYEIRLIDIFGGERKIGARARVRALSLVNHKIILEPL